MGKYIKKKFEYIFTGFAKQSKLNGVYVLRDEKINGAISFAEKGANTILAKGHNGHWWWDDDLADFEHDKMRPDGVWAWAQKNINFDTANSITANEWDDRSRQWKYVGAGRCRTALNKQPLASIYTGYSNSQQCKNKCEKHPTCIGIQYLGRYRHCWLYGGAFSGRVNLFKGPSKDEITKIAGPESLAECWAWKN